MLIRFDGDLLLINPPIFLVFLALNILERLSRLSGIL